MKKLKILFSLCCCLFLLQCNESKNTHINKYNKEQFYYNKPIHSIDSTKRTYDISSLVGTWRIVKYSCFPYCNCKEQNFDGEKYIGRIININNNSFEDLEQKRDSVFYQIATNKNTDYLYYKVFWQGKNTSNYPNWYIIYINSFINDYNSSFLRLTDDTLLYSIECLDFYLLKDNSVDTVRCKEGTKCAETGFVLKGSRKNGKAIHVKPKNTNVPMED